MVTLSHCQVLLLVGCAAALVASANARLVTLGDADGELICVGSNFKRQTTLTNDSSSYITVFAGLDSTCGIVQSGEGICAGEDDDAVSFRNNATLTGLTWEMFGLGSRHACGIDGDQSIYCWGPDPLLEYGQRSPPLGLQWVDTAAGSEHSCGITVDGDLRCWGRQDYFYGLSDSAGVKPWKSITTGKEHSCGIDATKGMHCFGQFTFDDFVANKQFRDGCCGDDFLCGVYETTNGTSLECVGASIADWILLPPTRNDWIGVTCSTNWACGHTDRGHIHCFGLRPEPNIITRTDRVYTQVVMGEAHTCFLPAETVRPQVSMRSPVAPGPTSAFPIIVYADVSEIIEEFYSDQFIIGLGSGGNFVNEGTKIRFEVYPAMDGFVTVSVPENAMIDPSLNGNFASDVLTVLSDRTPPYINLTTDRLPGPTNWVAFPFRIIATEALSNYSVEDIVVGDTGGVPYNLTFLGYNIEGYTVGGMPVGSFELEFWVEPFEDGVINVTIPYGWGFDPAFNPSIESNTIVIERDTIRPNVTLTSPARRPTNIIPIPYLANFTETMFDVDFERFIVEGVGGETTLVEVDEESKLFYFDVYPNEDGIVNVTVLAYTGTDDALNYNYESNIVSIELDTLWPNVTLEIPLPDPTNVVPLPAIATFSEQMQFLNFSRFFIGGIGGYHDNITTDDNFTFHFLIYPYEDGVLNVTIQEAAGTDDAWNPNMQSNSVVIESDTTPPTVRIESRQLPATNQTVEFYLFFNERMFGVEEDDFIFGGVGGTVVGLEDISSQYNMPRIDMVFLLTVLPLDQGRIDLNLSVVGTDEATNPNVPAPYFTGPIYDTIPPVASLYYEHMPGPVGLVYLPLNLTLTYTEKMYGLNATGCFEVTGVEELWRKATVEYNNVTEVTTVYLTIMVSEEGGVITIAPIAGHATDLAGNLNTVANTLTFEIDASRPELTIELLTRPPRPEAVWLNWPVTYYVSVSEAVVEEFHPGMVKTSLPFAEIKNFTVLEPYNYTFEIWNAGSGFLEIWVEEKALQDLFGNLNVETREEGVEVVEFFFKPIVPYTETADFIMLMLALALAVLVAIVLTIYCLYRLYQRRKAARIAARKAAEERYHREEQVQVVTFAERRRERKEARTNKIHVAEMKDAEGMFPSFRVGTMGLSPMQSSGTDN